MVKAWVDTGSAPQADQPGPKGPESRAGMTQEALACVSLVGKVLWLAKSF